MKQGVGWTRRAWLAGAGAGVSLAGWPLAGCGAPKRPRNVVLLVSDGMSGGVPQMAETFSRLVRGRGTHWAALAEDRGTAKGFFETSTLVSIVTDSAAASSAWGSGCKVVNGAINVFPDGTALEPVMATLKRKGISTGLVTTARVTHATPAGFAATAINRAMEDEIAAQYLGRVDVLMGGGAYYFDPDFREDGEDLAATFSGKGYEVLRDRKSLSASGRGMPVLGLFGIDHLPFTIDEQRLAEPTVPTLAEMTRSALERLGRSAGFFLVVEGARVDHAAHANDLGGLLWDQLAFDDALGEVLAFQKEDRTTLVVVTTDHGNANPGVNGVGPGYQSSRVAFEASRLQVESFTSLAGRLMERLRLESRLSAREIGREVNEALGLELAEGEEREVAAALAPQPQTGRPAIGEVFFPLLGRVQEARTAVGWSGIVHTSDWAMTLATGPGQERFGALQHHTALYGHLGWFFGFESQNRPFQGKIPQPVSLEPGSSSAGG